MPPVAAEASSYAVEIAPAGTEAPLVRDSMPAVITRFVPGQPLAPGNYSWRVGLVPPLAAASGPSSPAWSPRRLLCIQEPAARLTVPPNASMAEVQAIIARAAALPGTKGVYFAPTAQPRRLSPAPGAAFADGAPGTPPAFVNLTGATDLLVDGQGARLVFTAFLTFFSCLDCERVVLANMTLDFDPLPYTALGIRRRQAPAGPRGNTTLVGDLLPGHPPLESNPAFAGVFIAEVMDAARRRVKRGGQLVVPFHAWRRLPAAGADAPGGSGGPVAAAAASYEVTLAGPVPATAADAGDVFVLDPRQAVGLSVIGGREVVLAAVTVQACSNECFTSCGTEALAIIGGGTRLAPGRYLAANNGGHNHHSARTGVWVEGGVWENAGDDTLHVSGLAMTVVEQPDATHFVLQATWPDRFAQAHGGDLGVRAGDLLQVWQRSAGQLLATLAVLAVSPGGPAAGGACGTYGSCTRVTVAAPGLAPGRVVPAAPGTAYPLLTEVFNGNRTANQLVVRRNTMRSGRRVGVLAKGRRALVERNTFEGLGGGGVELWPAPYEGLCAAEYVVRHNVLNDTNQLARTAAPMWATAFASGGLPQCHRELLFHNNTVAAGPGAAFLLYDVAGATLRGNTVTRCGGDPDAWLRTNNTRDTRDLGNTVVNRSWPWLCTK